MSRIITSPKAERALARTVHESEHGWELFAKFHGDAHLLVFRTRDLLMFDWDGPEPGKCLGLLAELEKKENVSWLVRMYSTANGVHGFQVSFSW